MFRSGDLTTAYIKQVFPDGFNGTDPTEAERIYLICAAAFAHAVEAQRASEISGQLRAHGALRNDLVIILGAEHVPVQIEGGAGEVTITVDGDKTHTLVSSWRPGHPLLEGSLDGVGIAVKIAARTEGYVLRYRGVTRRALVCRPDVAALHAALPEKEAPDMSKLVVSPMPGLVVSVDISAGQEVKAGEAVCIVEAMKMQNIIRAEADGVVRAVNVAAGDAVAADEIMIEFE